MSKWYTAQGNNSDVVVSSKIRLARNLVSAPFPSRMSNEVRKMVCKKIFASIKNSPLAGEFDLTELQSMNDLKKVSMAEQGIISPEFAKQNGFGSVIVSKDESVSIMLCEEDHIRLSAVSSGQSLEEAYKKADELDDILINNLKIAFSEKLGFLTSNPMNLGKRSKASFILHLPAISAKGMILSLTNMVSKLGFDVKPVYSDNSDFYELSKRITFGITEKSAIEISKAFVSKSLSRKGHTEEVVSIIDFEDKIFRAMGTLKMARKLTAKEFYSLISLVRLGISMGSFNEKYETVSRILHDVGTATIMSESDEGLTVDDTEKIRAQYVRESLA